MLNTIIRIIIGIIMGLIGIGILGGIIIFLIQMAFFIIGLSSTIGD